MILTKMTIVNQKYSNLMRLCSCQLSRYLHNGIILKRKHKYEKLSTVNSNSQLDMSNMFSMPKTLEEMQILANTNTESPPNSRIVKVALIGVPNSGKSSLINALVGWKVSTVSKKVHTTLNTTKAIQTIDSTQMVLLDAPGTITPEEFYKHNVGVRSHLIDPESCFKEADLIAIVHDASNVYTRDKLHPHILKLLILYPHVPVILVLNKIDALKSNHTALLSITNCITNGKLNNKIACQAEKYIRPLTNAEIRRRVLGPKSLSTEFYNPKKGAYYYDSKQPGYLGSDGEEILETKQDPLMLTDDFTDITIDDIMEGYLTLSEQQALAIGRKQTGWSMFQDVFMVSAKRGFGIKELKHYIMACAYPSPWIYPKQMVTTQDPLNVSKYILREKLLHALPTKFPYLLKYTIQNWNLTSSGVLEISILIDCPTLGHVKFISSKNLKYITNDTVRDLRDIFCCDVNLHLNLIPVKVNVPHWVKRERNSRAGNVKRFIKDKQIKEHR